MINNIAYYLIFGKPLIMYMGILTLLTFLLVAYIGHSILTGKSKFPLKWHLWIAGLAIFIALLHGTFGILSYF